MKIVIDQKKLIIAIVLLFTIIALALTIAKHHVMEQEVTNIVIFTNPKQPREARIPFTLTQDGLIKFYGMIGPHKLPIVLDTGADQSTIPVDWNIGTRQNGQTIVFPDPGGNEITAKPVVIGRLSLENCAIIDCTARELQIASIDDHKQRVLGGVEMHLGNSALWNSKLTIDYHNKVLTISPSDPGSSCKSADGARTCTIFSWNNSDGKNNLNAPIMYGRIADHKIMAIVDTGTGGLLGLSPSLAVTLNHDKTDYGKTYLTYTHFAGGNDLERGFSSLTMVVDRHSLNDTSLTVNARSVTVNQEFGTASAIIGMSLLRNYLITLDYPHRIITLSPQTQSLSSHVAS